MLLTQLFLILNLLIFCIPCPYNEYFKGTRNSISLSISCQTVISAPSGFNRKILFFSDVDVLFINSWQDFFSRPICCCFL